MDDRGDRESGGEVHSAFGVGDEDEANHISAGLDGGFGGVGAADFDEGRSWSGLRGGGEGGGFW